jgi:23S rRNA (uracil1939-C5)-methyltransferase
VTEAQVETVVERLNRDGEGVAGRLRAPGTLPGERVRGRPEAGVLVDLEVIEPAPERVAPPCRHFGVCGGCALQHASDAFVAGWKGDAVARALAARGLAAAERPTVATSPPRSRRRAVFAGRRTRKGAVIGFHGRRSGAIVDLADCLVVRPALLAARPALAEVVAAGGARDGVLRLAVTSGEDGIDLDVRGAKPLDAGLRARVAAIAETHDLARLAWDRAPVALRRPPRQRFGRVAVIPPPGAFLQATAEGAAALIAGVRGAAGDPRRAVDLFAGCGTFALPLAEAAEVHAVEADADMLAALDAGWRGAAGLRRLTTEPRDLFRRPLLPAELARFDAAVLDPPRAGAEAQARALAASRVPRVAMVSCDPASFARDAAILGAGGYRLRSLEVVDQFRWSGHIEVVAAFAR